MVPRFLMPPWLQGLSWVIPNTWAIEAYDGLLLRNSSREHLLLPVGLLAGCAIGSLLLAWFCLWRGQRG
jgi:ABC-2 type transport system permease protein